ncbi:uncharacterized protein LOC124459704 isoform X2 [Drosophila willistoni]|uniref:uncharacterized protein LOC124459704 isoform X2 n=1 Tax=Drosophila willistoni TaxID=7260 RepID=UPI001F082FED|nr:uncharacterized protein LOC124459704 isoform X2 [Drosophila willistoni]
MERKMFLNIFGIFCLFMANGLCEKDVKEYIQNIRHDYCIDYCANKCKYANVSEIDKKCTNFKNIVITDKYTIELLDKNVTLTWKIYPVNLNYLNKLTNRSDCTAKKLEINVDVPRTETNSAQVFNHIIIPSIRYMEVLNLKELSEFQSESILLEKDIDVKSGASAAHLQLETPLKMNVSALLNNYFSLRMEKLREVYISNSSPEECTLYSNVFDNATQLERIEFNNINLAKFSKATVKNLTKIKILKFIHCNLTSHEFLRSNILQNNLEVIKYDSLTEIEYNFFKNYKNLHKIDVSFGMPDSFSKVSSTNITAFVCINRICLFNLGTNGKRCPKNCICQLSPLFNSFGINCDNQGIRKVSDLPTPITAAVPWIRYYTGAPFG